jgi:predicted nucleotidyltransferase
VKAGIHIDQPKLADFCREWRVTELSLFGSVLREDFQQQSDVDVLVSFAPEAHYSLAGLLRMEAQLAAIFGRKVDLVTRHSIEASENYIRRKAILSSAQPIYAG